MFIENLKKYCSEKILEKKLLFKGKFETIFYLEKIFPKFLV